MLRDKIILKDNILQEREKRDLIIKAKNDNYSFQMLEEYYFNMYKKYMLKNFYISNGLADEEDILQYMRIALWYVIDTYNDDLMNKDFNIDIVVFKYMKLRVMQLIKTTNRMKHSIANSAGSYYSCTNSNRYKGNPDEKISIIDFVKDKVNVEEEVIASEQLKILNNQVEKMKKELSGLETKVLELRIKDVKYKEIAKILNTNIRSVDNAVQRIRKKFKKLYKAS